MGTTTAVPGGGTGIGISIIGISITCDTLNMTVREGVLSAPAASEALVSMMVLR
jgi:hypothetical protein